MTRQVSKPNIFWAPSLETARKIDDGDTVNAIESARYRFASSGWSAATSAWCLKLRTSRRRELGDAEDIFIVAQSYIECVRLAACQLEPCEESEAIAAVAMAAYQKIEEGLALINECPEVRKIGEAEAEQLRRNFHAAANASPVPVAPRPARTRRSGT